MSAGTQVIEKVLRTTLLSTDLCVIPPAGASSAQIATTQGRLGRELSRLHRDLLGRWNGLNLDIIRFYGCDGCDDEIPELTSQQRPRFSGVGLVIGSDPAGFVYLEGPKAVILSYDSDGGAFKEVAADLDDFLCRLVFGASAGEFAGEDWLAEVEKAGLLAP